jgi:membrane protein YqaA with SNARE-associated domain
MNRKRVMGIVLLIVAIVVLAGGAFTLVAGHMKTGIGLFVLGVVVIGAGLYSVITGSSREGVQLDTDWR